MDITLLVALEGGGVTKRGMTGVFIFFEVVYLSAADEEIEFIRRLFCLFVGGFFVRSQGLGGSA